MTLGSITFCGYTVAGAVSIVGFVMEKQEGITAKQNQKSILQLRSFLDSYLLFYVILMTIIVIRLNNEQRAAVADYFRVYKVLKDV